MNLEILFKEIGYQVIPSNLPEFAIYFHIENGYVNVISVIDYKEGIYLSSDQYEHNKAMIQQFFQEKGLKNIHILSIVLSDNIQKAKSLSLKDRFCWMIDKNDRKLIIYEEQTSDFYGMKGKIENWLRQPPGEKAEQIPPPLQLIKKYPWVTITLTSINVLVYLLCMFIGDTIYSKGILYAPSVLEQGEFYRLFSSLFMHADVDHLFNNMILLFFAGEMVEKELGYVRYILLYFIAGLGGNVFSIAYDYMVQIFSGSIGASGAIFGIIGALFSLVIMNRGKLESITFGRMFFLIIFSLYSGFVTPNIDNAAHIGGLLTGFLVTFVLLIGLKKKRGKRIGEAYEN